MFHVSDTNARMASQPKPSIWPPPAPPMHSDHRQLPQGFLLRPHSQDARTDSTAAPGVVETGNKKL